MKFEQYDFQIPQWCLSALINGDYSGLSDEEEKLLDKFCTRMNVGGLDNGHWSIPEEESYFSHSNDVNNCAGNVVDMVWNQIVS